MPFKRSRRLNFVQRSTFKVQQRSTFIKKFRSLFVRLSKKFNVYKHTKLKKYSHFRFCSNFFSKCDVKSGHKSSFPSIFFLQIWSKSERIFSFETWRSLFTFKIWTAFSVQMNGITGWTPFKFYSVQQACLEAGYGGVWAPNFGGAAPGFEPGTSCMRVIAITLRGPPR